MTFLTVHNSLTFPSIQDLIPDFKKITKFLLQITKKKRIFILQHSAPKIKAMTHQISELKKHQLPSMAYQSPALNTKMLKHQLLAVTIPITMMMTMITITKIHQTMKKSLMKMHGLLKMVTQLMTSMFIQDEVSAIRQKLV